MSVIGPTDLSLLFDLPTILLLKIARKFLNLSIFTRGIGFLDHSKGTAGHNFTELEWVHLNFALGAQLAITVKVSRRYKLQL